MVLSVLPDESLVQRLEEIRDRGRNDYPIRPTWNAVIAGIIYQHPSIESLRRELDRNGELRDVCGFDPLRGTAAVPSKDAFTHFLESLFDQQPLLMGIFHRLVNRLGERLPKLGLTLAVDSKAIPSFGRPVHDPSKKKESDRRRDTGFDHP